MVAGFFLGKYVGKRDAVPDSIGISLNSLCPACGHRGCTLQAIPAHIELVGDKQEAVTQPPMVQRTCTTCGAKAYEKTILPADKWVAK